MKRTSHADIFSWIAIAASICFAFGWAYLQWQQRLQTLDAKRFLSREVRRQEQEQSQLESGPRSLLDTLTAPASGPEDAVFLSNLTRLMKVCNVSQEKIEQVPVSSLPPLESQAARSADPADVPAGSVGEPALLHLPLGVSARSRRVTITGQYADVYHFLQRVQGLQPGRVVNTNSIDLQTLEGGGVRAVVVLTRFVRPAPPQG